MVLIGFAYTGAVILLWLIIFTLIAYATPDSLIGRVLSIVK